jgi:hypothetical protein
VDDSNAYTNLVLGQPDSFGQVGLKDQSKRPFGPKAVDLRADVRPQSWISNFVQEDVEFATHLFFGWRSVRHLTVQQTVRMN